MSDQTGPLPSGIGATTLEQVSTQTARISWGPDENIDVVRRQVARALTDHPRVEAHVAADDESGQRIARARRLRGEGGGGFARGVLIPVLDDALDRSLVLAGAMDSRGYGRRGTSTSQARRITGALLLAGVSGITVGTYGVLDGTTPRWLGGPVLAAGVVVAVVSLRASGQRVHRTTYRSDPWRIEEWFVVASGLGAAVVMFVASDVDPTNLYPSLQPLQWPTIGLLPALAAIVASLPAIIAPPPPQIASSLPGSEPVVIDTVSVEAP